MLGIVAIPLGIAKTSGVLEATVVEGEVPLLLPVKLLKHLQAVIDIDDSQLFFRRLGRSVPLFALPSGHVAVEILDFGKDGFVCPSDMHGAGYNGSDFRIPCGPMPMSWDVMLSQASTAAFPTIGHGSPLQISSGFRWCAESRNAARSGSSPKFEESAQELAHRDGQSVCGSGADWCRSIGELVVAGYSGKCGPEVLDPPSLEQLAVIVADSEKLSRLKSKLTPAKEMETCLHPKERLTVGANQHAVWVTCADCHGRWKAPDVFRPVKTSKAKERSASSSKEEFSQAQMLETQSLREELALKNAALRSTHEAQQTLIQKVQFEMASRDRQMKVLEMMKAEYASMAIGQESRVPSSSGLPRQRDAHLCRKSSSVSGGDAAHRSADDGECGVRRDGEAASERLSSSSKCFIESSRCEKGGQEQEQSTWVRLKRPCDLREKVKELGASGQFSVAGIFVETSEAMLEVKNEAELDFEDECLVKVQETLRGRCEDGVEDAPEINFTAEESEEAVEKGFGAFPCCSQ